MFNTQLLKNLRYPQATILMVDQILVNSSIVSMKNMRYE